MGDESGLSAPAAGAEQPADKHAFCRSFTLDAFLCVLPFHAAPILRRATAGMVPLPRLSSVFAQHSSNSSESGGTFEDPHSKRGFPSRSDQRDPQCRVFFRTPHPVAIASVDFGHAVDVFLRG